MSPWVYLLSVPHFLYAKNILMFLSASYSFLFSQTFYYFLFPVVLGDRRSLKLLSTKSGFLSATYCIFSGSYPVRSHTYAVLFVYLDEHFYTNCALHSLQQHCYYHKNTNLKHIVYSQQFSDTFFMVFLSSSADLKWITSGHFWVFSQGLMEKRTLNKTLSVSTFHSLSCTLLRQVPLYSMLSAASASCFMTHNSPFGATL